MPPKPGDQPVRPILAILVLVMAIGSAFLAPAGADESARRLWVSFAGMCHGGPAGDILFIAVSRGEPPAKGRLKNDNGRVLEGARAVIEKHGLNRNCYRPMGPHPTLPTQYFNSRTAALAHAQKRHQACLRRMGKSAGRRCKWISDFPFKP